MTSPTLNLGDATRQRYWSTFDSRVAAGESMPLVLPYSVLGIFVVPALWLAIPHRRRPWVYASRWPLLVACLAFNVHVLMVTSSRSFAYGYASGLMAFWGCVVCCDWLVWTRPQFDLARVMRRRKRKGKVTVPQVAGSGGGHEAGSKNGPVASGIKIPAQNGNGAAPTATATATGRKALSNSGIHTLKSAVSSLGDADFEYYWQAYPEDEPFLTRLDWIADLITSFRGAGWNWAISSIPNPPFPSDLRSESPVDPSTSIPQSTRSGFRICPTQRDFLALKLRSMALSYAALDFLAVNMMKDPYFILGPQHDYPLPVNLASLGPLTLHLYRAIFVLTGVYAALQLIFSANDLAQYYLVARLLPGGRAELWHHASIFGGFRAGVLDRGLAGFWGIWWHQTFRFGFKAPTDWLFASYPNLLDRKAARMVAALVAFTLSGLLHACGSFSSVPHTSPWRPPLFFLLQFAGVVLQAILTTAYADRLAGLPRWVRRAGNAVFVAGWLLLTAKPFMDDLATAGIWLLEPVPVSPLRWLGYGQPGDSWWRWNASLFSQWYVGKHWWQSGLAV